MRELVEIEWLDSTYSQTDGWLDTSEVERWVLRPLPTIRSVGWLVAETDDHVTICMSHQVGLMSDFMKIPWCAVLGYWKIKLEK